MSLVLAAALTACNGIDPLTVPDPVSERVPRVIEISVGLEPSTKVNINVEEIDGKKYGVVSFSEDDVLTLIEKIVYTNFSTVNLYKSTNTVVSNGGKSANFTFTTSGDYTDAIEVQYAAATGTWKIDETTGEAVAVIPDAIDATDEDAGLLPSDGIVAMTDWKRVQPDYTGNIFEGSVALNYLVSFGVIDLNIEELDGLTIQNLTVSSSTNAIAGAAKVVEVPSPPSDFPVPPTFNLEFDESSGNNKISIDTSVIVDDSSSGAQSASIWFSTTSAALNSINEVVATDASNNKIGFDVVKNFSSTVGKGVILSLTDVKKY